MKKPEKSKRKRALRAKKAEKRVKRRRESEASKPARRAQYDNMIKLWKHKQDVALEKLMSTRKPKE